MPAEAPSTNWSIEFYVDPRNRSPVTEFLAKLSKIERAEARNTFRLLQEFGTTLGMPHARPMIGHGRLWELRAGPNRLLYFAHVGRRFVILHGFRKKSQKTPVREIATAERRMVDFLEREYDS
jgi:phage-related protein